MSDKESFHRQNRLRQLRAFCHAAQTGSISRAAERLNLSQPSVSLQIQALEKELDTVLFERRGPRIRLTPAGEMLHEMSLPLVDGMDRLGEDFKARLGEVTSGTLNIASGESTLLYLLPDYIKEFGSRYPQISVRLHNVTGRDGMGLLSRDEVDFAVGSMNEVPEDFIYYPIFTYEPRLIVPVGHPLQDKKEVNLEDISPYGLILPPQHLSTWRVVDNAFRQHNVPYEVTLEAGGWEVIKRYVEIGLGVSIVTSICLRGYEKLGTIPMGDYFPKRTYGIVVRRGKFLSPQAKRFLEIMSPQILDEQNNLDISKSQASGVLPPTSNGKFVKDLAEQEDALL
ncbi:MAG TPA: LysR family transcriptional regulator [Gammaproteobacteria bacterium]|nr:LysR family transcriptional regulator [Gammaproteobacteria bacterium]